MACSICTSELKEFIEDLSVQEVSPDKISEFVDTKFKKFYSPSDIEYHCVAHFNSEAERKLRIAIVREKMRQSDEGYELGQQKMMNTIQTMNYLLENVVNRYKYLLVEQEGNPYAIKERDLVSYIQQIRETTKLLHELNKEIKNEDYIPKKVFQEESARLLQFVADILSRFDRKVPGYNLKDEFIMLAMKEYRSQLNFAPQQAYIETSTEEISVNDLDIDDL